MSIFGKIAGIPAEVADVVKDAAFTLGKIPRVVAQLKKINSAVHDLSESIQNLTDILEKTREDEQAK